MNEPMMSLPGPAESEGAEPPPDCRIGGLDWPSIAERLDAQGHAVLPSLLTEPECRTLEGLYDRPAAFRSTVVMERHAFGLGEYKYFDDPLPPLVALLRARIYPRLAALANTWAERLRQEVRYPNRLDEFLATCRAAGQSKPTPLLLRYRTGGFNCLHQDLYGEVAFPFQMVALLSEPAVGFTGGEFLLVEQRPRRQSKAEVVPLGQGDAVIFASHSRPVESARGYSRAKLRHGVSRVIQGQRTTLGIIFHDSL